MNSARNNNGRIGGATDNGRMNGDMSRNRNNGMDNGMMNGNNRMNNGMNGNGNVGGALTGDLAEQIRALTFVKEELELYLDTHPRCKVALDYYNKTLNELKRLTEQYQNTVGPLTTAGVTDTEMWTWVLGPWPWQQAGDFMRDGDER